MAELIIVFILVVFTYLVFKPEPQTKSKELKQEEIKRDYKQKLLSELSVIQDRQAQLKRKTELLKVFASELHDNLFFEESEVKAFINELSQYEASQSSSR